MTQTKKINSQIEELKKEIEKGWNEEATGEGLQHSFYNFEVKNFELEAKLTQTEALFEKIDNDLKDIEYTLDNLNEIEEKDDEEFNIQQAIEQLIGRRNALEQLKKEIEGE